MSSEWVWHGHAAHFIGWRDCLFRLATSVAGGRYVVSTVGEYYPMRGEEQHDVIGDWAYETAVLRVAGRDDRCGCPVIADFSGVAHDAYNDARAAAEGHLALCRRWDKETT